MTEVVTIENTEEQMKSKGFSAVLGHRDFARLWSGQLVSNIGTAISSLALMFYAFSLTGSAMAMAILAMVQTIPVVIFAGFVGVYVDQWNRKKIMVVSDIVRAITILLIPLSIYFPTFLPTIYWVYILTFIYATANAWFFPARSASIPNLVEGDELVAAYSLSQMTFQVVQLVVPPVGGILVALLAPDYFLAFAITAMTFVFSAIALRGIKTNLIPTRNDLDKESLRSQIIEGGRFVIGNAILSFLFVFAMMLAASSGILNALLMPYFEGELGLGSAKIGLVLSAGAATGAVTAIYFSRKKEIGKPLYIVAIAGLLAGFAIFAMVLAFDLVTVMLSWAMIGAVDVMLNIPITVIMQQLVSDELRGRVFALLNVAFTAVQVMGMGIGGLWAEAVGSTGPPLIGAAIAMVFVSLIGFAAISIFKLHSQLPEKKVESEEEMENAIPIEVPT
ncbi:MAG: MFS transporter [Candidatus Thorarchaeota archaeon]|nr:MAG: MFS transporter [Candidatus Thorarchaeota archaeon]